MNEDDEKQRTIKSLKLVVVLSVVCHFLARPTGSLRTKPKFVLLFRRGLQVELSSVGGIVVEVEGRLLVLELSLELFRPPPVSLGLGLVFQDLAQVVVDAFLVRLSGVFHHKSVKREREREN